MFIKRYTRITSYQIGTRHVLHGLNKFKDSASSSENEKSNRKISDSKEEDFGSSLTDFYGVTCSLTLCFLIDPNVAFEIPHSEDTVGRLSVEISVKCSVYLVVIPFELNRSEAETYWCVEVWIEVVFTVKSLHAGTLVIHWTTAPSKPLFQSRKAQLAPLLFLFFILTIATRCYASTKATYHQLDQLQTSNLSQVRNSKIQSSNNIISRLIQSHFVQKRNASPFKTLPYHKRIKRVLSRRNFNHISEEDSIPKLTKRVPLQILEEVNKKSFLNATSEQRSDSNGRDTDVRDEYRNVANFGDIVSVTSNFSRVTSQKLNYSNTIVSHSQQQVVPGQLDRPMPPVNGRSDNSLDKWGIVSIITFSVTLAVTLGVITCILSHHRAGAVPEGGGTASDPNNAALTPTSAPMLSVVSAGATAGVGGMERLRGGRATARDLAASRERQVRLHALRTDFAVNLPPSITMPDGEDHPYSNARLHIRDAEQEAEIYQKCIRPPPNRTVLESESPPPYRSSSAGLLGSSSSSSSSAEWSASGGASNAPLMVVRCHSMSSSSSSSTTKRPEAGISGQKTDFLQRTVKIFTGKKSAPQAPSPAPTLPAVVVPSGSRRRPPPDQSAYAAPTSQRAPKGGV